MELESRPDANVVIYLEQNHADMEDIITLLEFPKVMTGLIPS